jgi:heme/copper-type cytochrome/quinol oxidase subunit 2
MGIVNLAADYGWGPYSLLLMLILAVVAATAGFFIVMATTRMSRKQSFASKTKVHPEGYWAIGVATVLAWLWINSYPWMPPVAFSSVNPAKEHVQVVDITAGQWFWLIHKEGQLPPGPGQSPYITLIAGQPVKFVAHSVDVNHGFGIMRGSTDSAVLLQMQVIPKLDNVFYYTFKEPGTYFIRCLEYCGYAHPYMTSLITVLPYPSSSGNTSLTTQGGLT